MVMKMIVNDNNAIKGWVQELTVLVTPLRSCGIRETRICCQTDMVVTSKTIVFRAILASHDADPSHLTTNHQACQQFPKFCPHLPSSPTLPN